jgi:PLP dependent protein
MASLAEQYEQIKSRIAQACARAGREPSSVALVAVSKTATVAQIRQAVDLGIRDFGENRLQVFTQHATELRAAVPIRWHMIGHLQRNKVPQILVLAGMIHSLDSLRLAREIDATAAKLNRKTPVLLQVNAGEEPQKHGFAMGETVLAAQQIATLSGLELCGLMSMAPLTEDQTIIRSTFAKTRQLFDEIKGQGIGDESFRHLSMGMSHDFEIAIEQGATLVRIGSLLFGETKQEEPAA